MAPAAYQIKGVATGKTGGAVTYRIQSVETNEYSNKGTLPRRGSVVRVGYPDHGSKFIDVGKRYLVFVWLAPGPVSGVKTAQDKCGGGGTTYADGTAIATWLRPFGLRPWSVGAIAAGGLLGLYALSIAGRRARRRRGTFAGPFLR